MTLAVACDHDHVLADHLDAFAFPLARTVSLHVNTRCLHEATLVLACDLADVVVLHLDAARADVFDAEAVGLTAQLGDYLAFALLLRLHFYSGRGNRSHYMNRRTYPAGEKSGGIPRCAESDGSWTMIVSQSREKRSPAVWGGRP